ncbi:PPC domain-containing DNA-binding protein [Streptomyces microflavus]|uniref:PPC domain-containing DNA-binding protein n=1 Tax=Streptomyces microflavus TaxID=1919 RepID=UPI0039915F3C
MMRATQITVGRKFAVVFEHDEDFFEALDRFCRESGVRAGYLTFIGGFSHARLVGTCEPLEHPERPLWEEVEVENLEVLGNGTLAWDPEEERVAPHIHLSAGLKADSADGRTSHLQGGTVQFLAEVVIEEWSAPEVTRVRNPDLYDVPLLRFAQRG